MTAAEERQALVQAASNAFDMSVLESGLAPKSTTLKVVEETEKKKKKKRGKRMKGVEGIAIGEELRDMVVVGKLYGFEGFI